MNENYEEEETEKNSERRQLEKPMSINHSKGVFTDEDRECNHSHMCNSW